MTTQLRIIQSDVTPEARTSAGIGFPVAVVMAGIAALAFGLGIATPPRSGAFCTGACIAYPYSSAGQFFPRDYFWMVPGILLTPLFTILIACLHFCVASRAKPLSLIALCFSSISTAIITTDYLVQILVVQPSLQHRELDGIALLTQYNPRGLFIAFEDLGYLMLAVAFLFAGAAMPRSIRPGVSLRWTLVGASLLAFAAFLGLGWRNGTEMGLPFELAIISIDWIALVVVGILLSLFFRRARRLPAA